MMMRSIGSRISLTCAGALLLAMAAAPAAAQQSDPIGRGLAAAATTAAREAAAASSAADAQGPAAPADPQAPAAPAENPTLKFFAGTELSGFVDTYYSYNFNKPAVGAPFGTSGVTVFNQLHNFDVAHNAFSLSLAEVALEKKPTAESRGGFRVDLDYGSAAAMVAGFEPGGTTLYQNIQQAYVSYLAPAGKGSVQLDIGKFVTPAGFEVIEAKDNWNYSRGLLFALAIPYYHMGMRAAYSPNDKFSVTGFLFNGWNNVVDNNTGKSVGVSLTAKPTGAFTIIENYIGGPETTGDNTPWRHLSDTVLTYTVSKAASVAFNYDWAKDGDAQWQGAALYLKYQANDWFAVTPRYELFKDRDGFATGAAQNVQDFTLTTEFKHKDGVIMRIEYRGDFSNTPYFLKETSELKKNQQALTIAWIYAFSSKMP
jgi:Putative beta-barrel porin-2, OmpL-like. bbp2